MSATLGAGIQLCSLCDADEPFGNHGTGELNEKLKNTSEKRKASLYTIIQSKRQS